MFGCRFCALHPCPLMGASPASSCAPPRPPVFCPPKPHSSLYFWGPLSRCLLTIPTPIGARTSCRSLPSCVIDGISVPACVEPICSSLTSFCLTTPPRTRVARLIPVAGAPFHLVSSFFFAVKYSSITRDSTDGICPSRSENIRPRTTLLGSENGVVGTTLPWAVIDDEQSRHARARILHKAGSRGNRKHQPAFRASESLSGSLEQFDIAAARSAATLRLGAAVNVSPSHQLVQSSGRLF